MIRVRSFIVLAASSVILARTGLAVIVTENFSSNPLLPASDWSFGVGNNGNNQFTWNNAAPSQYTGDAVGSLGVHFDSTLPTARLQRSLGVNVTQADDFVLKTRFSFDVTAAGPNDFMQFSFGLVNSSLTGANRTGTSPTFGDADTFHSVEFDYFPNVSPLFGGPTLTPSVFGAQVGSLDAFGNFASIFGPDSNLGDNGAGFITELPELTVLEAELNYSSALQSLTLTMRQVNGNGSLTLLNTGVPALSLAFAGKPFTVDSLAILAYRDAADGAPASVSLIADVTFEQFDFTTNAVPEPATLALLGLGAALVIRQSRRSP